MYVIAQQKENARCVRNIGSGLEWLGITVSGEEEQSKKMLRK